MILLNAIYFKGTWQKTFQPASEENFYLNKNEKVSAYFMRQSDDLKYTENRRAGVKVLDLPYIGTNIKMTIFLPYDSFEYGRYYRSVVKRQTSYKDKLNELENALNGELLEEIFSSMQKNDVAVNIPKFKIDFKVKLNDALKSVRIKYVFQNLNIFLKKKLLCRWE